MVNTKSNLYVKAFLIAVLSLAYSSFLCQGQVTDKGQKVKEIHQKIGVIVNTGKVDSIRQLAYQGKLLARSINNLEESAYFNYILGSTYRHDNTNKARLYLDTALIETRKANYPIVEMLVYGMLGTLSTVTGKLDSAIYYHEKAFTILSSQPPSTNKNRGVFSHFNNVAMIHKDKGDYPRAIEMFVNAYKTALDNQELTLANYAVYNIGLVHTTMKRFDEAKIKFEALRNYADSAGNAQLMNWALLGLAEVAIENKEEIQALKYYHDALSFSKRNKNNNIREILLQIGSAHIELNQLDSAEYYLNESSKLVEPGNDRYFIRLKKSYAQIDFKKGDVFNALSKAEEALLKARELETENQEAQLLKFISDIYIEAKDYEKGYAYFLEYNTLQDSLFSTQKLNEINRSEFEFKTEIKNQKIKSLQQLSESQIAELKRKNQLIIISIVASILFIILLYIIHKHRTQKATNREMLARLKLANAQLNPHFLFNSLSAIQQLVLENKDVLNTSDYLAKFSKLTRRMLDYTELESITLEDELLFLGNYLDLQKLRFGDKFRYEIQGADSIDANNFSVPPLISQPFVENSLEHGFKGQKGPNKIVIKLEETGLGIKMIIEDNGIGIDSTLHLKNVQKNSKAFGITKERIKFWSRKTGRSASMDVLDLSKLSTGVNGTRITLNLPTL